MKQHQIPCNLCDLEVKIAGFSLDTIKGKKSFCCEGCKAIYKMQMDCGLIDNSEIAKDNPKNTNKP